jgi:protein Mpv17
MKRTTVPLLVSGLKLWPLAHCVTYGLVPVENRLLWVDFVEIFWVTILATTAAAGNEADKDEKTNL